MVFSISHDGRIVQLDVADVPIGGLHLTPDPEVDSTVDVNCSPKIFDFYLSSMTQIKTD